MVEGCLENVHIGDVAHRMALLSRASGWISDLFLATFRLDANRQPVEGLSDLSICIFHRYREGPAGPRVADSQRTTCIATASAGRDCNSSGHRSHRLIDGDS
jgi:hypothetical protein